MRQRNMDFIVYLTVGSGIGGVLHASGLPLWLVGPAGLVAAAVLLVFDVAGRIAGRWVRQQIRQWEEAKRAND